MPGSLLGNRVPRLEDPLLLTAGGTYVADVAVPGLLHLVFVRSPFAHARLLSVHTSEAASLPGVAAAFTATDLSLPDVHGFMVLNPDAGRPPLARGKVRFAGDAVAAVVADTAAHAVDAAEAVVVDYDPLPAVADPEAALAEGAPLQFDEIPGNLAAGARDPGGDDPLAGAARVIRVRVGNQRIAVVPMEPNAITAVPDGDDLTIWVSTQMPHGFHAQLCKALSLDPDRVRVIAPHVGGAFGAKAGLGAEHAVVVAAARRLGRPVAWAETRSENLVATPHGRGQVDYVEMGFDGDGRITGLSCRVISDAGAYAGFGGALGLGPTRMMASGVYRIPKVRFDVAVALTNTTPMGAFRGAGRPEAAEYLERVMDVAAAEMGIDPVELRRRNLVRADQFPFTTPTGTTYDCGDYAHTLERAVCLAGYDELRAEQARRRAAGERWLLGIGLGVYVEVTGGGGTEYGAVEVEADGGATIRVGTSGHGQGHATSFAMIVADRLGIPLERVRFIQSDTALVPRGGGTGGSRSLQLGGTAVAAAADGVLRRARELAAEALEADVADIVVTDDGRLGVAGVPARALGWRELAARAAEEGGALATAVDEGQAGPTFPFGAHVAVVEVDRETGYVRPLRHIAVDDCGRILNPLIVAGQQHGGIAQGMSQALWEQFVYDPDGNPLTANLADYAMPSAAEIPNLEATNTETPTPLNPLGAKGIGESGTIGSTPAVHNAVIDAVSHLGVRHIDMPCTPERVWRAITAAEAGAPAPTWVEPPEVFNRLPVRGQQPEPEAARADI
ncbi:MAG: xanthine dehydrogenase family protein molybdopterin-binding subunit [Actinomycetota bacterium]|jgi:carbon-monoxide dehydrogenase large subunit|nr:xanthine dehydrogenase family protein molybdopterin-binding subunit [Actinomycetota bacterium]